MSRTSNLHDDESDHESVNELLSPSDGYFTDGHTHPGEVLVPDPSQARSHTDKEREAREEEIRASTAGPSSMPSRIDTSVQPASNARPQSQTHTAAPSSTRVNESTPLIPSAPPAYSPPEPGSPYHSHTRSTSTAGIYETMGRPEPFFPNTAADLGGDRESLLPNGRGEKRWSRRVHDWWEDNSYKVFKYIMLTLAFIIAIGFLTEIVMEITDSSRERRHDHEVIDVPGGNGVIPSSCKIRESAHVNFTWEKPSDFMLIHLVKPSGDGPRQARVQNMGKIHIRTAPKDTEEAVKVDMIYSYSSHAISEELEFTKRDNSLRIHTAADIQDYSSGSYQPCLYLDITLWLRADLKQEDLLVDTTTLSIIIEKDLTAQAQNFTVSSLTGSISSIANDDGNVSWGGRDITIITDAASINGAFPLYDKLHLETRAGSITTDLTLHPGRYNMQTEALLILRTAAGSIHAKTPVLRAVEEGRGNYTLDDIPERDYRTEVTMRSGSAELQLVHGSHTSIVSDAGSVHAELTPWLEPRKDSNIRVDSKTGGIDLTVRDSILHKGEPLRHLYGDYIFPTGHLRLRYPSEWEGEIHGRLMTGSVQIDWPGLEVNKNYHDGLFNRLEGRKGKGDGYIKYSGASGSVELYGKGGSRYPRSTGMVITEEEKDDLVE